MLSVKVEVTLANVVCGSSRTNKHHDFVVPLFTLFPSLSLVDLFGIIRNNAIGETSAMCVCVISILETRTITWYRLLPPISFIVTYGIRVTVVVTDTLCTSTTPISECTFGTTQL